MVTENPQAQEYHIYIFSKLFPENHKTYLIQACQANKSAVEFILNNELWDFVLQKFKESLSTYEASENNILKKKSNFNNIPNRNNIRVSNYPNIPNPDHWEILSGIMKSEYDLTITFNSASVREKVDFIFGAVATWRAMKL